MGRREADRVWLITRNGYDFTERYPKIAAALAILGVRSCMMDGEATVVDKSGLSISTLSDIGSLITQPCCAPLTSSSSTALTYEGNRSSSARRGSQSSCETNPS